MTTESRGPHRELSVDFISSLRANPSGDFESVIQGPAAAT